MASTCQGNSGPKRKGYKTKEVGVELSIYTRIYDIYIHICFPLCPVHVTFNENGYIKKL
ncbi:hypothetical protein HanHA300_Chr06g0227121 [Helianthus annuus]|nr:hypothetical protein HanHA300_Chr06g0227121 [Helianthus annuus]KAJ0574864.1 hypothetical protein HanHA89_Chr06g0243091 [Helianthus annuus]KAJ0739194.1 hypothetical protein HanLR1_Chr06g0227141 [Helianthus annuus]KAJ0742046.1 hypothetical protein HanOQP8_Chr06g0235091 [Helianthus annuus]